MKSYSLRRLSGTLLISSNWSTDVGKDTSFSDGGIVKKLVKFFIISDGE
jgi:hypothetical protein